MAGIRDSLNQVWALFRKSRIADDFVLIEHVAALLLEDSGREVPSENLRPRMPALPGIEEVRRILAEAAGGAGGAAALFDRSVLFRLPTMLPGGRYPTPRHIVQRMLRLAEVEPTQRLGDLACGSGGFLVHRTTGTDVNIGQTTGVEISPEWARLAWTNARLHGLTSLRIQSGNALQVCASGGTLANETFDRILMNPPFGERVDVKLAEKALGQQVGSRSETALTALALNKLVTGGRAAILVPSGLLFSNSTGERELRTRLVDEYELEAIVSLPKDAFQPFSTLQTHILLVHNTTPEEQRYVWFLQAESDGYPSGRGRDLTESPYGPTDLPLVEGIFASRSVGFEVVLPDGKEPLVGIKKIRSEHGTLLGVVIEAVGNTTLTAVSLFPAIDKTPQFVLADGVEPEGEQRVCAQLLLDTGEVSEVKDRDTRLRELYKPRRQDPTPGALLFRGEVPGQAVAISTDGRLIGVTVPRLVLRKRFYDLRPDQYVKKREEPRAVEAPALLLGTIRRNQSNLLQHIDRLLGRLELTPIAGQQLPSPLFAEQRKAIEPFGNLSSAQQAVWNRVRKKVKNINDSDNTYETAALFTPMEVEANSASEVSDVTRSTLDLLERMGVIVSVTVADPTTGEPIAFYRLVTERDRWPFDTEGPSLEGENA